MKKKASTNYFFPTLLFIIFIFAGLTSFLQLFGFCAARFDVLADSLALAIVFAVLRRAAKAAALFRRARCERALDPAPLRVAQKIVQ